VFETVSRAMRLLGDLYHELTEHTTTDLRVCVSVGAEKRVKLQEAGRTAPWLSPKKKQKTRLSPTCHAPISNGHPRPTKARQYSDDSTDPDVEYRPLIGSVKVADWVQTKVLDVLKEGPVALRAGSSPDNFVFICSAHVYCFTCNKPVCCTSSSNFRSHLITSTSSHIPIAHQISAVSWTPPKSKPVGK
jgi:hypothetical protein